MKKYLLSVLCATTVCFNLLAQYAYEKKIVLDFFSEPCKVVTGDLNNDNYEEVISAFKDKNYISYIINNAGVFSEPRVLYLDSSQHRDILIADITGDQLNDIVVTDYDHHRIGVFINGNNLDFKEVRYFEVGESPVKLYAHDFNKDNITDIAVLNEVGNSISLFSGNASSLLLPQDSYSTDEHPSDLNAGDFNADGYIDLVSLSKNNPSIQIFHGKADGAFTKNPYHIATDQNPVNVEVKDINGDSHLDIAVVYENSETVSIYYGNEQASFDSPIHLVAPSTLNDRDFLIEDFNNDGMQDLAVATYSSSRVIFFINQGNNTFELFSFIPSAGNGGSFKFLDLYYTDVTKQGTKGLFITNTDNAIFTENRYDDQYRSPSSFYEAAIWNDVHKFDVGDINNDGISDLIFTSRQFTNFNFISIFLGKGDHKYEFFKHLPNNISARDIRLIDFNNDGLLDIFTIGNEVEIFLNSQAGTFSSFKIESEFGPVFTIADFNEDGFQDLINAAYLYLNTGDGHFIRSQYLGDNINTLTSLDFNHDSHVDLAISFYPSSIIRFYPGIGDGTFGSSFDLEKSIQVSGLTVADLNYDHIDDLIITSGFNYHDSSYIYYGAEENAFAGPPVKFVTNTFVDEIYVFDIDQNDTIDVIYRDYMRFAYHPVKEDGTLDNIRYINIDNPYMSQIMQIDLDQDESKELLILSGRLLEIQTGITPITVKFNTLSKLYDGQPISEQIASSEPAGLPIKVSYYSSASLPVNTGTYEITAEIDDAQYRGAVKANFVINKAPLTVKANDQTISQGSSIPELTYTITGFAQEEDSTDIDILPVVSTTATENSKEGNYDIVVSGAGDNNYTFSYANGSLTINAAISNTVAPDTSKIPAVVEFTALTKIYDGQSISEQIATSEPEGLSIKLSYNGSASLPINAGTYEIIAEIDDDQYQGSAETNFVINKAPLVVKANDQTISQGSSIPELTYTITGFVQEEDSTTLDILPFITTTATENSREGNYSIEVSGADDDNYTFSYLTGSLAIDPITFIDEELDINLGVYPIPVEKYLTITHINNNIKEVRLKDMAGRILYHIKHTGNNDLQIPVYQLRKSVYLLEVLMKDQTRNTKRIIVE